VESLHWLTHVLLIVQLQMLVTQDLLKQSFYLFISTVFEIYIYIYELFLFVSLPGKHFCQLRTSVKTEFNKQNTFQNHHFLLSL